VPAGGLPNRATAEAVFRHVWIGGLDASDPARLQALREALPLERDPDGDEVKAELRAATEDAIVRGLFGVPTVGVEGRLFWGVDALEMVAACLQGDPWFEREHWQAVAKATPGIVRR